MKTAILLLAVFGMASASLHSEYLHKERSLKRSFENAVDKKIREVSQGDKKVEEALSGLKRRYVAAFNDALLDNYRQAFVNRRYVSEETVKRSFDDMQSKVHLKATRNVWGIIKDSFNDFTTWANKVLGDFWSQIHPSLIEVRDLAMQLIRDGAKQLSEKAKEEALKFFIDNAGKLTTALQEKITGVLATEVATKRSIADLEERSIADIWGSIKGKFTDFGEWAKQFLGDIWADVEPSLIEVRDMAAQLIKDKGKLLTVHAKEQALKFFQFNADKLTKDLEDKITGVLGTGEKEIQLQERGFSDIWGNIKDTFNDFGDWAKQFLGDVWAGVEPSLVEVRDMATQLIKDKAGQLTKHAKEQAMKFFQFNADKLTKDLEEKITGVLGTDTEEQETAVAVQERGIADIWGNIKDKFNDFGDWTKQFLGDVWAEVEPNLVEVRDMATQLIKDKAAQLTSTAREQALKFFQINADKLTKDLEDKITNVLGTGDQAAY